MCDNCRDFPTGCGSPLCLNGLEEFQKYPEKLVEAVNKYLDAHACSKLFYFDSHTSTPYKDKSITSTTYRTYILYGNYFKVMRYTICSNPEWNYDDVAVDSMIAWEIKMCFEKSGFFK